MSEWQPIETAPKDGTPVLLFARSKNATAPVILVGRYLADHGGWIESTFTPNSPVGVVPYYWMPLPAPPNGENR